MGVEVCKGSDGDRERHGYDSLTASQNIKGEMIYWLSMDHSTEFKYKIIPRKCGLVVMPMSK